MPPPPPCTPRLLPVFTEFDERDSRRLVRDMLMTMPEERCQEDGARRAWLYNLLLHAV